MGAFLFFVVLLFIVLPIAFLSRLLGGIFGLFRRNQTSGRFYDSVHHNDDYYSPKARKRKKKVFDRNDGEYVEFEEIVDGDTASSSASESDVHYEREDQVSDAEWTEIK